MKKLPPNSLPPPAAARSGRPMKATDRERKRLKDFVQRFPFKTAREVKNECPGWDSKSVRYIQYTLQKLLGLPSRSAAKKPLLTAAMKKKRLSFAKKNLHWTEKEWQGVMFSDESTFRIINSRSTKVRRPSTVSRYKQRYTITTVKHSPSVMVWGCFSGQKGRGGLYFLPKNCTMNGERYKEVLDDHLIPFMRLHKSKYFLQDGAPCHKSKKVMDHLKEFKKEFGILDWPGNSPDLNPIENCWSHMKRKLKDNGNITSLPKLIEAIKLMWVTDMPLNYFQKLSSSMPKRLKEVILQKGEMTKY
jgi:transposase